MQALNPDIQHQIDKAKRFDADLLQASSDHWTVIIAFYSALHWVSAGYYVLKGQAISGSHQKRALELEALRAFPSKLSVRYLTLRVLSEKARYEVDPAEAATPVTATRAIKMNSESKVWAVGHLLAAGYTI